MTETITRAPVLLQCSTKLPNGDKLTVQQAVPREIWDRETDDFRAMAKTLLRNRLGVQLMEHLALEVKVHLPDAVEDLMGHQAGVES
jgi:hypothetical protein